MNPFTGLPFERLRFEYEKRERKLAQIKEDQRRTMDEYYEGATKTMLGRDWQSLSDWAHERDARFKKEAETLQQEINQIEEAMND
jgi:hypothetical protein